jgi:putative endonuclease
MSIECTSFAQAREIESHVKRMKSKKYIANLKQYPEIIQKLLDKNTDS